MLFERLAKGRVGIIAGRQRNFSNIHGAHAQFSSRAFQAHTADVAGNVLTDMRGEDAVKVGHRKACHRCQHFPVELLVRVLADVLLHIVDAFVIALKICVSVTMDIF